MVRDGNGVAAFAKPAGVLSHPNLPGDVPRALLTCAYDQHQECFVWRDASGVENRLWLLNRLDSATSGVILAASNGEVAVIIKRQFARGQVRKIYQALVFGVPRASKQVWRDHLAIAKRDSLIRAGPAGSITAMAHFTVLRRISGLPSLALVQLDPKTGRTHQLRVQCARRGLPIVGDQTYGDFRLNREFAKATGYRRLFLHSLTTHFSYELNRRTHIFAATAALPDEFAAVLG